MPTASQNTPLPSDTHIHLQGICGKTPALMVGHGGRWAPGPLEPGAQTLSITPSVPQDCRDRCCNTTTCQLAEGAECAHGACCHECRVSTGPFLTPARLCPRVSGWEGAPGMVVMRAAWGLPFPW